MNYLDLIWNVAMNHFAVGPESFVVWHFFGISLLSRVATLVTVVAAVSSSRDYCGGFNGATWALPMMKWSGFFGCWQVLCTKLDCNHLLRHQGNDTSDTLPKPDGTISWRCKELRHLSKMWCCFGDYISSSQLLRLAQICCISCFADKINGALNTQNMMEMLYLLRFRTFIGFQIL